MSPLFATGVVVSTPGALRALETLGVSPLSLLSRHFLGDWGDLGSDDKAMNDEAVKNGDDRILSRYNVGDASFYIITEADRAATTLLLCSEY